MANATPPPGASRFHITYIVRNDCGPQKRPEGLDLARGPLHRSATHDMHVKMRHALAAIRTIIDDEPKARVVETFLPGQSLRDVDQVAQKRFVGGRRGCHARDFSFRDDQDVDRRLWRDIVKSQTEVVFVGDAGRDFTGDDLGENRAHVSTVAMGAAHGSIFLTKLPPKTLTE